MKDKEDSIVNRRRLRSYKSLRWSSLVDEKLLGWTQAAWTPSKCVPATNTMARTKTRRSSSTGSTWTSRMDQCKRIGLEVIVTSRLTFSLNARSVQGQRGEEMEKMLTTFFSFSPSLVVSFIYELGRVRRNHKPKTLHRLPWSKPTCDIAKDFSIGRKKHFLRARFVNLPIYGLSQFLKSF